MATAKQKKKPVTAAAAKKRTQNVDTLMQRLSEEGERYRDLFEHSPIGIYRTTFEGDVILANPAIIRMLRYDSLEDLMSINVGDATTHPDSPRRLFIAQFDRADKISGYETKWLRKDGTTLHVRENARAVRDEFGAILYFEGTVEDITERKQAELELKARLELENLLSSMSSEFANAMPMDESWCDVISDTLGDVAHFAVADRASIVVSRPGTQSIRREFSWVRKGSHSDINISSEMKFDQKPWALKKFLRNEMVCLRASDRHRKDAELEYRIMAQMGMGSLLMAPWICSDRTVGAVVLGSVSDEKIWTKDILKVLKITAELVGSAYERKLSYDKLSDEQKLVRTLLDCSPDRIYFKDRQCRFIRANRSLCERHGLATEADILGKTDRDLFTDRHAEEAFEDDMRVMSTGIPVIAKEEIETWLDGSETWASTTKLPMYDDEGNVTGLMGISRDITARKAGEKDRYQLELQMMQAQKMESLGVMCGGIAHDFNNFLMGILGNAGLALMEMFPESPAWNSVKQIETVALRAAELTNQLLAYSGKTEPERRIIHLGKLVREMAHLLRVSIPKSVEITYAFEDDMPGVDCDPVQVRQVVMNLMINASEAMGEKHGRIEVETGVTMADEEALQMSVTGEDLPAGEYVFLKIRDNGSGMARETVSRIFDPFFTTKPNGHGLGMAVVMGVIKAHRGGILVESELGKGTCFTILLPSAGAIEFVEEEVKVEDASRKEENTLEAEILIVEDDEIIRTVARRILENCGFKVCEAADGDLAVQLLEETDADRFGLVMLDVTLPGVSGKDVLERIKELKKDVPIILMSGYNELSIKTDYGISGYDGFLKKPFDAVTMVNLVKECCDPADDQ